MGSVDIVPVVIQEVQGIGKFIGRFRGEAAYNEDMIGNSRSVRILHDLRDLLHYRPLAHQVKDPLIAALQSPQQELAPGLGNFLQYGRSKGLVGFRIRIIGDAQSCVLDRLCQAHKLPRGNHFINEGEIADPLIDEVAQHLDYRIQ